MGDTGPGRTVWLMRFALVAASAKADMADRLGYDCCAFADGARRKPQWFSYQTQIREMDVRYPDGLFAFLLLIRLNDWHSDVILGHFSVFLGLSCHLHHALGN